VQPAFAGDGLRRGERPTSNADKKRHGNCQEERDIGEISSLTVNPHPLPRGEHTIMKLKNLKKKIQRLEKRLREGPKKLAKLKQRLKAAEAAKAVKAARKSAARARAPRPVAKPSKSTEKKTGANEKARKKPNFSPERRAQLAVAMKARWAAKKAAEGNTKARSSDDQHSGPEAPQAPESRPDGA
jgi:DNA repair exonuclease SbcCD ATPase subunit